MTDAQNEVTTSPSTEGNHTDNGITSASAYRKEVRENWRVTLPSGAVFLIRKPDVLWFAEHASGLPTALLEKSRNAAAAIAAGEVSEPDVPLTPEESEAHGRWRRTMLMDSVLAPRVVDDASLAPGAQPPPDGCLLISEIDPADLEFIYRYLTGQVTRDGRDLAAFPGKRLAGSLGADGKDVRLESK